MGMEAEALVAASGFNNHTKAQLDHWGVDATQRSPRRPQPARQPGHERRRQEFKRRRQAGRRVPWLPDALNDSLAVPCAMGRRCQHTEAHRRHGQCSRLHAAWFWRCRGHACHARRRPWLLSAARIVATPAAVRSRRTPGRCGWRRLGYSSALRTSSPWPPPRVSPWPSLTPERIQTQSERRTSPPQPPTRVELVTTLSLIIPIGPGGVAEGGGRTMRTRPCQVRVPRMGLVNRGIPKVCPWGVAGHGDAETGS